MLVNVTHWVALYSKLSPNYLWYIDEISLSLFISLIIWVNNICSKNFIRMICIEYDFTMKIFSSSQPSSTLSSNMCFQERDSCCIGIKKRKKRTKKIVVGGDKNCHPASFFFFLGYGLLRDPFICRHVDSRFSCIKFLFKFNETLLNYFLCTCLDGPIQDWFSFCIICILWTPGRL